MMKISCRRHILKRIFTMGLTNDVYQDVSDLRDGIDMPDEDDLDGSALALIRLQQTYDLEASDMVRGKIAGFSSPFRLSARDCAFLGQHSFHAELYDLALEWYDQALLLVHSENDSTIREEDIQPFRQEALFELYTHQSDNEANVNISQCSHKTPQRGENLPFRLGKDIRKEDDQRNYRALCQGLRIRDSEVESGLHCYLSNQNNFYFYLHPVKVEEINKGPPIYMFHDVISDPEIDLMKKIAHPLLEPATVVTKDGMLETSMMRTSQYAWFVHLNAHNKVSIDRIMRRLSFVTGLQVHRKYDAEDLQVANYGIAGHYHPHHDFIFKNLSPLQLKNVPAFASATGDRIATLMFYLSDVPHGGATVFPRIGAAVWPHKGAAVFWYNLRRNGDVEQLSLHGACPVVHGSKWVANKWIREINQLFSRPCGLSDQE